MDFIYGYPLGVPSQLKLCVLRQIVRAFLVIAGDEFWRLMRSGFLSCDHAKLASYGLSTVVHQNLLFISPRTNIELFPFPIKTLYPFSI
jgi:hypothetical protein